MKKRRRFRAVSWLCALILFFTALPHPAAAEQAQAQNLTVGATMTLNGANTGISKLKDGAYTSKISCKDGDTLKISSDTEIWSSI